jgi:hypothetical protein
MRSIFRTRLLVLASAVCSCALVLFVACSASGKSARTGTVAGTVVRGTSETTRVSTGETPIGLAGVTVSVSGTQCSAVTDSRGHFALTGVPAGEPELHFERADVNARGRVSVAEGAVNRVTVVILGTRADIVEGRRSGTEIEGLVSGIDKPVGTLTVLDEHQQAVVVHADNQTVIRKGDNRIALAQVPVGSRVHVEALTRKGWTLATEVLVEGENPAQNREVEGLVTLADRGAGTFVVKTETGPVTVTTDASTVFQRRGSGAGFSDIVMGAHVDVIAAARPGGTLRAVRVSIGG